MGNYARTVTTLAYKDALVELRTRESLVACVVFVSIVVVVFAFALDLAPATAHAVAPGLLWVTVVFAGLLALGRSFTAERERGCLDGLLLAPVDPSALYIGKVLGHVVFMLIVLAVALPVFTVLLGVPLLSVGLAPVAALSVLGFAAAGTLFAALTHNSRSRDVLLPTLFLPLAIPVIITAVGATHHLLANLSSNETLGVMAATDALYLTVGMLLFAYTLEE